MCVCIYYACAGGRLSLPSVTTEDPAAAGGTGTEAGVGGVPVTDGGKICWAIGFGLVLVFVCLPVGLMVVVMVRWFAWLI